MTNSEHSLIDRIAFALAFHAEKTTADIFGKETDTAIFHSRVQNIAYMYKGAAQAALAAMGDASTRKDEETVANATAVGTKCTPHPLKSCEISLLSRMEAKWNKENEVYKASPSSYNEGWVDGYEEAIQDVEAHMGDLAPRALKPEKRPAESPALLSEISVIEDAVRSHIFGCMPNEMPDAKAAHHAAKILKSIRPYLCTTEPDDMADDVLWKGGYQAGYEQAKIELKPVLSKQVMEGAVSTDALGLAKEGGNAAPSSQQPDDSAECFERWAKNQPWFNPTRSSGICRYFDEATQAAWEAWGERSPKRESVSRISPYISQAKIEMLVRKHLWANNLEDDDRRREQIPEKMAEEIYTYVIAEIEGGKS